MIEVKIPLKKYLDEDNKSAKIGQLVGKEIVCKDTHSGGILSYVDILGICRDEKDRTITTVSQAYVVEKMESMEALVRLIFKYKPTDLWF